MPAGRNKILDHMIAGMSSCILGRNKKLDFRKLIQAFSFRQCDYMELWQDMTHIVRYES